MKRGTENTVISQRLDLTRITEASSDECFDISLTDDWSVNRCAISCLQTVAERFC